MRKKNRSHPLQHQPLLNHLEKTHRPSNILRGSRSRPGVLALMSAGCGVCVSLEGWANTISMANFLFFSTGVLKHSRLSSSPREPMRSPEATAGWDTGRSLVSKHLAGQGFYDSLNLRMKKKGPSDLQGSKCALGAWATVASLSIFKWGFLKEVGATSRPCNIKKAEEEAMMNTWKSVYSP